MTPSWRGIFVIVVTPFTEGYELDEAGLRKIVRFCIEAGARAFFNRLLPLINYERLHGVAVYKEILYRRGVITTRVCRAPGRPLDAQDQAELDAILADVAPLFRL